MVNNNTNNNTNRVSGSSFLSDEEFVVIRLGGQNMSKPVHTMTKVVSGCTASPPNPVDFDTKYCDSTSEFTLLRRE